MFLVNWCGTGGLNTTDAPANINRVFRVYLTAVAFRAVRHLSPVLCSNSARLEHSPKKHTSIHYNTHAKLLRLFMP